MSSFGCYGLTSRHFSQSFIRSYVEQHIKEGSFANLVTNVVQNYLSVHCKKMLAMMNGLFDGNNKDHRNLKRKLSVLKFVCAIRRANLKLILNAL